MTKQLRTYYAYHFEDSDRQALKHWLKKNNLKLKSIHPIVKLSYTHLVRVVNGQRPATATLINKLRKMGVRI